MTKKKDYLNSYLLQGDEIRILNEMILKNPSMKNKYLKKINQCEIKRQAIEKSIEKISDQRFKLVLYEKYICGRTLVGIGIYPKTRLERLHPCQVPFLHTREITRGGELC